MTELDAYAAAADWKSAIIAQQQKRIAELEAVLRSALEYVERVGGFGEGGTCDHAVTLDAIQEALKKRTEFIQAAADTKTTLWPTNLDRTAWGEK